MNGMSFSKDNFIWRIAINQQNVKEKKNVDKLSIDFVNVERVRG